MKTDREQVSGFAFLVPSLGRFREKRGRATAVQTEDSDGSRGLSSHRGDGEMAIFKNPNSTEEAA